MKTTVDFSEKRMEYDHNDLIFANRNRNYGAYELRKNYNKRLLGALLISAFLLGSGITVPLIYAFYSKTELENPFSYEVTATLSQLDEIEKVVPPALPPIETDITQSRVLPPRVVDTIYPANEGNVLFNDIPVISPEPPVVAEYRPENDDNRQIFNEPDNEPLLTVDEPAKFNGGDISNFITWVYKNIVFPNDALLAQIQGRVTIQFTINSKGILGDLKLIRGVHPSLNNECMRVLSSSPQWEPPKHNGHPVKQLFVLPLTFKIN